MADLWEFLEPEYRRVATIRTEECEELLAEVKALVTERETLNLTLAYVRHGWDTCLKYLGESADLNEELRRENRELRAELELERSRYTLGGIPPKPNAPHWVNVEAPRVSSADDPAAPPLRRSDTSSSFRGGESRG